MMMGTTLILNRKYDEASINAYLEACEVPWRYSEQACALDALTSGSDGYRVELEHCETSAGVLFEVFKVQDQKWASDSVVIGLIEAIRYILQPTIMLCPHGQAQEAVAWRAVLSAAKADTETLEVIPEDKWIQVAKKRLTARRAMS